MIEYIKEYGITNLDYESILNNIREDILELFILSEVNVREVMSYYNSIGIKEDIAKLILNRPDLLLIDKNILKDILSKTEVEMFKGIVQNNVEDLILLGI